LANPRLVEIYKQARKDFADFVGETPEDYKVLVFIDPELHSSLQEVIELGDSPHAILSQEQIATLQKARDRNFIPDKMVTVYPSKPTMIYMTLPFELEENPTQDFALRIMFIHAFAHAYFAEKSASNDSEILTEIYRMDMVIKELIMNNAYGLREQKNIGWGLTYFQDMVAVIRLLSTFGVQDFYIPPESSRKTSFFQNFLLEVITFVNKRAELIKKKNLTSILAEAFANYVHKNIAEKILESEDYPLTEVPRILKPIYGPPMNHFSAKLVDFAFRENKDRPREVVKQLLEMRCDVDLLKKAGGGSEVRKLLKEVREAAQSTSVYWHADTSGYWKKTWNIYENTWDKIDRYLKFITKNQTVNVGQWLESSDAFQFYGYVKVDSKPVYVFEIDDESIGLEQLLILHNHSLLYREDFKMPVPGFPDIIMFKKLDRMVVATLLSIGRLLEDPISPWDVPTYTRAIDVSKELLDYVKAQDAAAEEEAKETALLGNVRKRKDVDYSHLEKMSQTKLASVRVLIDEIAQQYEGGY
jgi:hypothetical protein